MLKKPIRFEEIVIFLNNGCVFTRCFNQDKIPMCPAFTYKDKLVKLAKRFHAIV